jgi:outer membrane protein assembly factor BamB
MKPRFKVSDFRKTFKTVRGRLSPKTGNILVYVVMIMVIFAVLGVAMVSIFSTSISSSATRNDTRRAAYLMESGIRFAQSELRASDFSKSRIAALNANSSCDENLLHFKLSPTEKFCINIFSPWFEPLSAIDIGAGNNSTEVVEFPEGALSPGFLCALLAVQPECQPLPLLPPLTIVNDDYIDLLNPTKPNPPASARGTITNRLGVANPSHLQLEISDDGTNGGFVANKNDTLCFAVNPSSDQDVSVPGGTLSLQPEAARIFPAVGGVFEINRHNYYYVQAIDRTTHVELTGITAVSGEVPNTTINARTTDYVILSPRNRFIVSEGKSGEVAFGKNMDFAAGVADTSIVGTSRKPDIEFEEEETLSDKLSQIESDSAFAGVDDVNRRVTFQRTSGTPFAAVWFNDTRAIGGQREFCLNGRCLFGDGIRAFFIMTFAGPGDGFTFSLLNAVNNSITSVGGDFDMGELMGYAGDGRTGTDPATYIEGSEHGLEPPKMAVEFDGFYNNSPVGYCADAINVNHSTRFDPEFSGSGKDTVQYVFWGSRNPVATPCRAPDSSAQLYDDNRHNAQDTASLRWAYSGIGTSEITQRIKASPDGTTIYAISGDNDSSSDSSLVAIDSFSGTQRWEFPAPPPSGSDDDLDAIAVDNAGHIYLGSDDNNVFARTSGGGQLWAPFAAGGQVESPIAVSESPARIYFGANGGGTGTLYAVNKATGNLIWFFNKAESGEIQSGVAFDPVPDPGDGHGTIYFGSDDEPFLYAVRTNGSGRWQYPSSTPLSDNIQTQPVVNPSNRDVIFATTNGRVYALPYSTSSTPSARWTFNTGSSVENALAISPNGNTVYVGTMGGVLFALRSSDGTQLWRYPASISLGPIRGKPAVDGDGTVYFGSENGHVYALNPDTGALTDAQRLKWVYPSSGSIGSVKSAIEIGKDGNILFLSDDGNLYSINPSTIPPNLRNLYLTDTEVQAPGVSGPDWFSQGTWAVRVEVDRNQTQNVNGKYEYTLRTWMRRCTDAANCSDIVGTLFGNTRLRYDYKPLALTAIPMTQTIELVQGDHDLFDRFLFGFTSGSGSNQDIAISRFQLSFVRPNDPVATADPNWP